MATPLTRRKWLAECEKLAKVYEDAMTNPNHTASSWKGSNMTNGTAPVTQEDREAAAAFYGAWGGTKGWSHLEEPIREGIVDDNALVQAFAAHRIASDLAGYERGQRETVARIVAWLNGEIEIMDEFDTLNTAWVRDAIEAGEWK